jgi:hypothetical protein
VQTLAQSSRWHRRVVFERRTCWVPNVMINSQRLFIPEHEGESVSVKVWKIGEGQQ